MHKSILTINRVQIIIALTLFVAFIIYFIPSGDNEIRVHDTYDGNFTSRDVLIKSGFLFELNPNQIILGIMNGLPRGLFPRFTEITTIFMFLFGSLNGMTITFILVRIFGFLGIYLFAKTHLNIPRRQMGLLLMVAMCYACLPVFTIHGLTVMGVPLVLWAYFNLYKNQSIITSLIIFVLFSIWSNFVLVGVHLLLVLSVITLFLFATDRKLNYKLILGILILLVVYIVSEYGMFYLYIFNSNYHSSRISFNKELGLNYKGVIGTFFIKFFTNEYSSANYFGYIFLPFFIHYLVAVFRKVEKNNNDKISLLFFFILVFSALFVSLLDWKGLAWFYDSFKFANSFNLKRFTNLMPSFFFILLLVSISNFNLNFSKAKQAVSTIILILFFVLIWRGNISFNRSAFDTTGIKIISPQKITFNQFFDKLIYKEIKLVLGNDTVFNVIHLGISPSPSKYAGLLVLDDYQGDYPLEYKKEFRKIIEGELNKSLALKKSYDEWGARSYMYSAEEFDEKLMKRNGILYIHNLSINTEQLKKMKCKNIISSIYIGNFRSLNLTLKKVFVSPLDYKIIFLYKLI